MNADQLLNLYDRVAEAPDAIARLRRFVLDLAVRGKLVEQDAADEPASKLLITIASERNARVKSGQIRKGKQIDLIEAAPWEAPLGWVWLPLGDTGNIFSGNSIDAMTRERLEKTNAGRPFIATKDVGYGLDPIAYDNGLLVSASDESFKIARAQSVLICAEGGSAGRKIGISDREICFGNKLLANETWSVVLPRYILFFYQSPSFYEQFARQMSGIIGGISINKFLQLPFPLPPLAEQHRIVAKVDELMALLDGLEQARTGREVLRDQLTAATLNHLTESNTDDFHSAAHFALQTLSHLTTRPDQIKTLRQTILNLAVRGKLIKQSAEDDLAFFRNSERIESDERPFLLPIKWQWVRVSDILEPERDISYGVIKLGDEPKSGGVPTLRCSDVRPGYIDLHGVRKVSPEIEGAYARTRLRGGEILINIRGTLGGVAVVPERLAGHNIAREVAMIPIDGRLSAAFFAYLFLSPFFWGQISDNLRGIAYKGLNLGLLRDFEIPLPPLAEQHRIAARVDALMALCDQLEAGLKSTETTRSRLLDAILHSALSQDAVA